MRWHGGGPRLTTYQQRKPEAADSKTGLARRATDTHLSGMRIEEGNSDEVWKDWEDAINQQEPELEPTQPSPLE